MDTALTLTTDMKLVLGLVGFTMAMFLFERIRADVVALVVLMLLGLTRLVAPENLFNGFSSNAVISVMATAHSTAWPAGCCGAHMASSSACCC